MPPVPPPPRSALEQVLDGLSDGLVVLDGAWRYTYANPAAGQLLELPPGELLGKTIWTLFPELKGSVIERELQRAVREGVPVKFERWNDALERRFSITAYPSGGGLAVCFHDPSGEKESLQELHEREESYRGLFERIPVGLYRSLPGGEVLDVNPALVRLLGYPDRETILRQPAEELYLDPDERRRWQEALEREGVYSSEETLRRFDGTRVTVRSVARVIRDDQGGVLYYEGALEDISDLRRAEREARQATEALWKSEERLRQAQKLEAVARLTGGVAHDFNNLLTVIKGNLEFALAAHTDDGPLREDLGEISKAADRASNLTHQLLAFSRRQVRRPRAVELNQLVRDSAKMLERVIGEDVTLTLDLRAQPGWIVADPGQIAEVLMNLAVNARDAMPGGGTICLETSDLVLDESHGCEVPGHVAGSDYLRLSVRDTGHGMDRETLRHIFEPFFTTKEVDKGTGLGLSTVHGIVLQSGGCVQVESSPGEGAVFHLHLPRGEPGSGPEALREQAGRKGGGETVLVVEDEDFVRGLIVRVLERAGYRVLAATNGREALRVASEHPGRVDLLLTDVVMPVMGGKQSAELLSARNPGLKVVYISGYTGDSAPGPGGLEPGVRFLPKPFEPGELTRTVREVLDE
ncbi:MAG: PAS domain S-box protein [Longimicrobiaceae bacterium]